MSQIAFDFDQMILEDHLAANPWTGAPLHFTTDYYDPEELTAAFDRYCQENGSFACIPRSHMWHLGYGHRTLREPMLTHNGHTLYMFGADARCSVSFDHPSGCSCVGASMHQAICRECRWHAITTDDSEAVAAWHDHAMPGWRELPTMSIKNPRDGAGRPTPQAIAWIEANYPAEWIFPGAPTIRPLEQYGNRAVEGRSPLGGFDFAL